MCDFAKLFIVLLINGNRKLKFEEKNGYVLSKQAFLINWKMI